MGKHVIPAARRELFYHTRLRAPGFDTHCVCCPMRQRGFDLGKNQQEFIQAHE
jgi:hypothetical protein